MIQQLQDLDEFIVPHEHDNLHQLLAKIDTGNTASFNVRNAFFYLYWDNATTEVEDMLEAAGLEESPGYLRTLYKTQRVEKLHRHGVRSKFIVRPEAVVEVGLQSPWFGGHLPRWATTMSGLLCEAGAGR